jgi:hypothetical protein
VDGQQARESGGPLTEAELIAGSLAHVRQHCPVSGHLTMRDFLYTDVGFLSDVDPTDTDEDDVTDTDMEAGQ